MYVRSPIVSTVYKLIIVALVAFAVARSLEWYGAGSLRYFTLQSNVLVGIVTLYLLVDGLVRLRHRAGDTKGPRRGGVRAAAYLRGITVLAISVTGIVFHTMLAPLLTSGVDFNSHVLHTVVPVGFVLDWLVFAEKGRFRFRDIPVWIVVPLLYLAATLLVAAFYDGFYPYPFMDAATYGYAEVAENVVILLVAFAALGAVYVGIDMLLARWGRARGRKAATAS